MGDERDTEKGFKLYIGNIDYTVSALVCSFFFLLHRNLIMA